MSELHPHRELPGEPPASRLEAETSQDLGALRTTTVRDLPTLEQAVMNARTRRRLTAAAREEGFMSTIRTLKRRPLLATVAAVVAVALFLLVVPVPYQRTTAHDVTLTITGPRLAGSQLGEIAQQLKGMLGAERVEVSVRDEGAPSYLFSASVSARSGASTAALAQAFASSLATRGCAASATTTAKKQRVWGSVVAYALDRVISISMDGKSAAELEAEIRQRLAEAGVSDASVSVTDEPGGGRKVGIEVKRRQVGDPSSGVGEETLPQLELTQNGAPVGANGFAVKVEKMKNESGMTLTIEVRDAGRTGRAEVRGADTMSDADVTAAIESQLHQAGIAVRVTVTGGEVKIERAQ